MEEIRERWILDTDCGWDDAQAIIIGLHFLDIMAITTVAGNTTLDNVTLNVARVLESCESEVPIYPGQARPLIRALHTSADVNGEDGMGDHPELQKMKGFTQCVVEGEGAAHAIIRMVTECPPNERINLCMIGPLTNLAVALMLEESIAQKIGRVVAMGGTLYGHGNKDVNKEFNFFVDPEAARVCFQRLPQITLLPWEPVL